MVSAALVLLTVSILAVHGKNVSTDGPIIPPGCEGKTLCDIKPADYPQEEIDNYIINNPDFHKRLKREFFSKNLNPVSLEEVDSTRGNCPTKFESTKPFQDFNPNTFPKVIVQSQFHEQIIQQVTCSTSSESTDENQCFGELIKGSNIKTKCIPRTKRHTFIIYDPEKGDMALEYADINVDCICAEYDNFE
ncbi:uncharacterized protein LOC133520789 [Cydia pomonella]|uniref:uncharacterized protein LOC133520789 n=1 Tax=Cydia pomonella TaxID=82600 RepID=UPI002ADDACDD|nr:uncharacterized protein LOC133520789 [Cydia pomonella]